MATQLPEKDLFEVVGEGKDAYVVDEEGDRVHGLPGIVIEDEDYTAMQETPDQNKLPVAQSTNGKPQ